jgi:small subunit ribosomal protein S8
MSFTDPIADLLTRIRNAQHGRRPDCTLSWSKIKQAICELLKDHGYLSSVEVVGEGYRRQLVLTFNPDKAFISLNRVSTPGGRRYVGAEGLRKVLGGHSHAIVSTSQGLITAKEARKRKIGGEVLCTFS